MSSDTAGSRGMVSVDSAMERPTSLSLARESSIYSLTLDEFQNHIGEPGKNFGSMNMDEFISNIWTAEESQAISAAAAAAAGLDGTLPKQLSLPRQGSLTLTAPLGRKTVEEVWSEIHKGQELLVQHGTATTTNGSESAAPPHPRQPTFGEMTLEDFLIKAGVVRNDNTATVFGNEGRESEFGQVIGLGYNDRAPGNGGLAAGTTRIAPAGIPGYQVQMMQHQPGSGDPHDAAAKRMGNNAGCAGAGRAAIGEFANGSFGTAAGRRMSSEGVCMNQMDPPVQYGIDMEMRCRKRPLDGPVEKVVERRQRRMIKNRESAARSRARKQAYTVELEAELNQLKEENTRLKKLQEEEKEKRKRKFLESLGSNGAAAAAATQKKTLRRTFTGPW